MAQASLERKLCIEAELGQSTEQNLHLPHKGRAIMYFLMQKAFMWHPFCDKHLLSPSWPSLPNLPQSLSVLLLPTQSSGHEFFQAHASPSTCSVLPYPVCLENSYLDFKISAASFRFYIDVVLYSVCLSPPDQELLDSED